MVGLKELNVLLLEDNIEFAQNTIEILEIYFKKIHHATEVKSALKIFLNSRIDIIISDIKVEDGNGLDFITQVREHDSNIPIVILSAHKDIEFLFKAIPLNILSYELKPLSYDGFNKLLSLISQKINPNESIFLAEGLEYIFARKEFIQDSKSIKLTKREALFIELLIKNRDSITSHEEIQRDVWQDEIMSRAGIKNLILRLRKKVDSELILTHSNLGYRLKTL